MAEKHELNWQAFPGLLDEGVDPFGVGANLGPRVLRQVIQVGLTKPVEAKGADQTVGIQRDVAKQLGQAASPDAPVDLHLPQAVLGMDVTLGAESIAGVVGVDVGNSPLIAEDLNAAFQRGNGLNTSFHGKTRATDSAQGGAHNRTQNSIQNRHGMLLLQRSAWFPQHHPNPHIFEP